MLKKGFLYFWRINHKPYYYHPGSAHGQNLWRGGIIRKAKLLKGRPQAFISKPKIIGGGGAHPAPSFAEPDLSYDYQ